MFKSDICEALGIQYPIIQGAMAWIADSVLASSVSNAGGLGIIAAGNNSPENVRLEIRKAKELTDKPFGVNIMLLSDNADEVAKIVCEEGVKVVTTGAGNPGKYMNMWKEHNIKVIPVVASTGLAKRMERSGADMLIAEGCEAGGHIGELTTMALLPQVVDAVNIPVIAAGGIGDSRGMLAALALGANGFQIGTRFLAANECTIHENYKKKVIESKDIDSVVTGRSTGHPVRVLRNRLSREYLRLEKLGTSAEELEQLGVGGLKKAVIDGDVDNGSIMAGQIAALIKKEESCEEIIKDFVEGTETLLKSMINKF
ncbi:MULTISPECIES: enoyl-[acyl-carrier-protein] reductase FabK [unclassified Clostridium]|uniref:Probable nitronate monooxygenase n=1 Tax=Clostridium sulfidigenes TaxID=318464 RepID=A0A927ZP55_9CLOT|nr:enoyl-[acyl-carrier-protein] reductase FabK [Clostridium sulfidigenes]